MRRFEFSEGSSNKFWEIEVDGDTVRTRWGRIGTDGQTKEKALADAAAAQKEADKQIRAKTKKGYAAVQPAGSIAPPAAPAQAAPAPPAEEAPATTPAEEAPAPEPAAAAAPTPAASSLPDEDTFVVPSSWKAHLHPRRGGHPFTLTMPSRSSLWKTISRSTSRDLSDDVDPSWLEEPKLSDLVASLTPTASYQQAPGLEALVKLVAVERGVIPALTVFWEHPRTEEGYSLDSAPGIAFLRRLLVSLDDAEYAAAKAFLAPRRTMNQRMATIAAYLVPDDPTWFDDPLVGRHHDWLLASVPDAASASQIQAFYRVTPGVWESLAVEFGEEILPALENALGSAYDNSQKENLARVLAELPYDDAARILLANADVRPVLMMLPRLVERFPRRTLRVAARLSGATLDSLLAGWVVSNPEAVDAVLAEGDAKVNARLQAIRDAQGPQLPEADPATLPPLLADPPWNRKTKRSKTITLDLEPDLPPPSSALRPSERKAAALGLKAARETAAEPARFAEWLEGYWSQRTHWTGIWMFAEDPAQQRRAMERLHEAWWDDDDALVEGLAVVSEQPHRAATYIQGRRGNNFFPCWAPLAAPEAAQVMLEGLGKKTQRSVALDWLDRHPTYAARAYVPLALGKAAKDRRLAESALRILVRQGHEATVRAAGAHYGDEALAGIEALLSVDPLMALPKRQPKTISFLNTAALPRPKLADRDEVLPLPAVEAVVRCFAISTLSEPYAGVEVLLEVLDRRSLADFTWALFQQWLTLGGPSKESWALEALGLVGDDAVAHKLTPLIRQWPGESQHKRAVTGLDVLLAIGTDVALMHLNGVALKVKFKGIKDQARERIQQLADSLGLTKEQLSDRLVPTLDLDEEGAMVLDYGPRQFIVGFDEQLKPYVRDEDGKPRKSLPKPGARDDAAKAEPAYERFSLLKKSVRAMATLQIKRLQNAMITGRRWPATDFRRFLLEHPLLIHLVRRLVWGTYDDGALVASFRVAEDGTLADAEDEDWELPDDATVGILHPIDVPQDQLEAWSEVLADYELLQPFPQLGRPVWRLSEAELASTLLTRHQDLEIPVTRVLALQSRGWQRGEAQDAGVVGWMNLPLPDGRRIARLWLGGGGLWTGMVSEQSDMPTIDGLAILDGDRYEWKAKGDVPFGELPAALASELAGTLEFLAEAAQ